MSYANEIERRVIYNEGSQFNFTIGRFTILPIIRETPYTVGWMRRIGTEVTMRTDRCNWILRTYLDGSGYYYPQKFLGLTRPALQAINDVINKAYYITRVIASGEEVPRGERIFKILKRKPLGETQNLTIDVETFGDFLTKKYNTAEQRSG